jgi:hypothetical protein
MAARMRTSSMIHAWLKNTPCICDAKPLLWLLRSGLTGASELVVVRQEVALNFDLPNVRCGQREAAKQ